MIPKSEIDRIAMLVEVRKYNQCPFFTHFEIYRDDDCEYLALDVDIERNRPTYINDLYNGGKFRSRGIKNQEWIVPNGVGRDHNFYEIESFCDSITETYQLCSAFRLTDNNEYIGEEPFDAYIQKWREMADFLKRAYEEQLFCKCGTLIPAIAAWLKKCYSAFSTLFDIVDYGNLMKYASLCKGSLKNPERYKSIIEAKTITDKILNYAPQLAKFSEQFEEVRKMVLAVPYYKRNFDYDRMRGGTLRKSFEMNLNHNFEYNENTNSKSR